MRKNNISVIGNMYTTFFQNDAIEALIRSIELSSVILYLSINLDFIRHYPIICSNIHIHKIAVFRAFIL